MKGTTAGHGSCPHELIGDPEEFRSYSSVLLFAIRVYFSQFVYDIAGTSAMRPIRTRDTSPHQANRL